jgi:hypothetical protein
MTFVLDVFISQLLEHLKGYEQTVKQASTFLHKDRSSRGGVIGPDGPQSTFRSLTRSGSRLPSSQPTCSLNRSGKRCELRIIRMCVQPLYDLTLRRWPDAFGSGSNLPILLVRLSTFYPPKPLSRVCALPTPSRNPSLLLVSGPELPRTGLRHTAMSGGKVYGD